jgi:thymidylate synthase (FAD)
MESHAQFEIRSYAKIIGNEIVSRWCPIAWEAFRDYRMNSLSFSVQEIEVLKKLYSGNKDEAVKLADSFGWLKIIDKRFAKNIERMEFEEKLEILGINKPWE